MQIEATTTLEAMIAGLVDALPADHNGAGDPIRRTVKIVNGKKVTAKIIGWGEGQVVFEVSSTGTKPLHIDEAARVVAA